MTVTAEKGAWEAEVLLSPDAFVNDTSGQPWSPTTPVRVSVSIIQPIGQLYQLINYGNSVLNAYEVHTYASSAECTAAQSATDKVCCGKTGELIVRTIARNQTLFQPYKLSSQPQNVGAIRVQATQGTTVTSVDISVNQGVVNGPFMAATLESAIFSSPSSDSLLIVGTDGSTFWAPSAALGSGANRIGVSNLNWRAAALACEGSATSLTGDFSADQWSTFRSQVLSSVCPAAEAVASIESNTVTGVKSVRFEGCSGQGTAVVLLRLDARAFTLVRRFAAPVITDAGLLVGTASPPNGGVIFVDVANKGAEGVITVALSKCCGAGGACAGFTVDPPVSHALPAAQSARFKLAFLVVNGRGDGAYCTAEVWQAGRMEGSIRVALTEAEATNVHHAPDGGGGVWNGPVSQPGSFMPNNTCVGSIACGCGAYAVLGECVRPTNVTNTFSCGDHGRETEDGDGCVCDEGWETLLDQPAIHFLWCTQIAAPPADENLKHYNTSNARLLILAPVLLALCCCCCWGYICTNLVCKIRRCCRRRKQKKKAKQERKESANL